MENISREKKNNLLTQTKGSTSLKVRSKFMTEQLSNIRAQELGEAAEGRLEAWPTPPFSAP